MHPTRLDTAILLFSRSAAEDSLAKPLSAAKHGQSKAIALQLIRRARSVAKHAGLPVFFISENLQHGLSFGERFADAFEQLFARGFERVISIGNDCPTLNSFDLQAAAQKLETHSAVIGPASDGGAYLIGLHRNAFNAATFAALNRQTERTLADLKAYVVAGYYCLPEKSDLDSVADLQAQLQSIFFPKLLKIRLLNILTPTFSDWLTPSIFVPIAARFSTIVLRGPPTF